MTKVSYKLVRPEKIVARGKAWGVILPTGETDLTVIEGQMPTVTQTTDGVVKVMSAEDVVEAKFFARRGMATICDDSCILIAEEILPATEIDYQTARDKAETDEFYKMIAEELFVPGESE